MKLSVFQSNVKGKILKIKKKIKQYLNSCSMACKLSTFCTSLYKDSLITMCFTH